MSDVTELPLPHGRTFIVDSTDVALLGERRWHTDKDGYVMRVYRHGGGWKRDRLHRLLMGALPGQVVDHINGNTLDNRRCNLRVTDARGNTQNMRASKLQRRGAYKGVHLSRGKSWVAVIGAGPRRADGQSKALYLGTFKDSVSAARAYDAAARRYFGQFAATNFPEEST